MARILTLATLLFLLLGTAARAAEEPVANALLPPSIKKITQTLNGLQQNTELSEERRTLLSERYEQTLDLLQAQQEFQRQLEQLDAELASAPRELEQIQRTLARTAPTAEEALQQQLAALDLSALEQKELELENRQQTLQQQLEHLNSQITTEQGRPERAQARSDQIAGEQAEISKGLAQLLDLTSLTPE